MNTAVKRIMASDIDKSDKTDTIVVKAVFTDINGNVVENGDNATKLSISVIKKDANIRKSTAYDNSRYNPFVLTEEVEAQLYSDGMIQLKSISKLKSVITNLISDVKLISLSLSIHGFDNEVLFEEDLVSLIFSKFSCIEYDFEKTNGVSLIMPYGTIKLVALTIYGGNVILQNDGVAILAEEFIALGGKCVISSNSKMPKFTLSAPKVSVNGIQFDSPINTAIIGKDTDELSVYQNYKTDVAHVKFNLSTFDKSDSDTKTGIFEEPLLEIKNIYKVSVTDVNIFGAQWYKPLSFERIVDLTVFDIERIVKEHEVSIRTNTVNISNCVKSSVFGLHIKDSTRVGKMTKDNVREMAVYAVYLNGPSFINTASISIADSIIDSVLLCNLDSLKAGSLETRKITSRNSKYITSDEQTFSKFEIRDSNIELSEKLEIYCGKIIISGSTIISRFDGSALDLNPLYSLRIIDSILDLNVSDIDILSKNVAEVIFKRDDIKAGSLTVSHQPISEYLIKLNAVDESLREFDIGNSSLKLDRDFIVSDMWDVNVTNTGIDCRNVKFSDIHNCYWDSSSGLKSQEKNIGLYFTNLKFVNNIIRNVTPGEVQDIFMNNCSGNFTYKLASNKLDMIQKLNLTMNSSKVNVITTSEGMCLNTQLESNNSLGSTVYGRYLNCIIVPKYSSYDARKFKDSYAHNADNDYVYYGTSTEKIALQTVLGL